MIGLRSLASGLPAKMILNPRKALADLQQVGCTGDPTKAQFIIMQTSGSGDPFSCNAPGTYDDGGMGTGTDYTKLSHPSDAASGVTGIDPVSISLGGRNFKAAGPWSTLPASVLSRTSVCHVMTNTPVHPKEPQVLQLMGATTYNEMFPSLLAMQLAPCLGGGTLQTQPISVGAASPSEALTFKGQALPTIPPTSLAATLTNSTATAFKGMTNLQALRDQTLNDMYKYYKDSSVTSPAQKAYIDSLVTSQQQVRGIAQSQLAMLNGLKNDNSGQITAAIALILMKVTPVIAVHFPFGGDNHADPSLATESAQTVSGMAAIVQLMSQLQQLGLQDQVTFLSLNVFGRTMDVSKYADGRTHNPDHQTSIMIGKGFKGGVVGGMGLANSKLGQTSGDWGCMPIDSSSGNASASGDIAPLDTLASWAKTVMTGVGVSSDQVNAAITDANAKPFSSVLA